MTILNSPICAHCAKENNMSPVAPNMVQVTDTCGTCGMSGTCSEAADWLVTGAASPANPIPMD